MPVVDPNSTCTTHIVVSSVSDNVKAKHLSLKAITDLQSGDYIVGSSVGDNAKEKHLSIVAYDDIASGNCAQYALGSLVDDNGYEKDMRIIDMPNSEGCNWVDITNYLTPTVGTWDGSAFHSERTPESGYERLNLNVSEGLQSGTVVKLRANFSPYIQNVTWSWPNSNLSFDVISPYPSNLYKWETNWNKLGMRFSTNYWNGSFTITKIEACFNESQYL